MIEKFTDVFTKGTKTAFKNPVLFLPYLFYIVLLLILYGVTGAVTFIGAENTNEMFFSTLILTFLILSLPIALIFLVIEFFIRVGLLGMAKDVVLTGKTSFFQLFRYGKQYFFQVLGIGVVTVVVAAVGYILFFFAVYFGFLLSLTRSLASSGASSLSTGEAAVLVIVAGIGLIWVFVTQLFFYFSRYAAVADDMLFEDAIHKSFSLFKENKSTVFGFILIALALSSLPILLMYASSNPLSYLPEFSEFGEQTLLILTIIPFIVSYLLQMVFSALIPVWSMNMYLRLTNAENEVENKPDKINETFAEREEQEFSRD